MPEKYLQYTAGQSDMSLIVDAILSAFGRSPLERPQEGAIYTEVGRERCTCKRHDIVFLKELRGVFDSRDFEEVELPEVNFSSLFR